VEEDFGADRSDEDGEDERRYQKEILTVHTITRWKK
jgi:hypothetical protein